MFTGQSISWSRWPGSALVLSSLHDHRDLHSFPTRRSSDLGVRVGRRADVDEIEAFLLGENLAPARIQPRSEEHTSELQSRRDLVCRLLLEKKNCCCSPGPSTSMSKRL